MRAQRPGPAQIHKIDIKIQDFIEDVIQPSEYHWSDVYFRDDELRAIGNTLRLAKATALIKEKYPELLEHARHGDMIEDAGAGYRSDGVYMIRTEPEFRVVGLCRKFDPYGSVALDFPLISEFALDHWDYSKMTVVDYRHLRDPVKHPTPRTADSYWHSDGVQGRLDLPYMRKFATWTQITHNKAELSYNGKRYTMHRPSERYWKQRSDGRGRTQVWSGFDEFLPLIISHEDDGEWTIKVEDGETAVAPDPKSLSYKDLHPMGSDCGERWLNRSAQVAHFPEDLETIKRLKKYKRKADKALEFVAAASDILGYDKDTALDKPKKPRDATSQASQVYQFIKDYKTNSTNKKTKRPSKSST